MVLAKKENRLFILLLITGAVYFFLRFIVRLIAPVLLAVLFVTIFGPLLQKVQKKCKIHRQLGAILLLLLFAIFIGGLVWILLYWIVGSLPHLLNNLGSLEQTASNLIHRICEVAGNAIRIDSSYMETVLMKNVELGMNYLEYEFLPDVLLQSLGYLKGTMKFGGFFICFLISTVLLAKDYDRIMNRLLDREECFLYLEIICGVIRYIATFVKAQFIILSLIGTVAATTLRLIGIRNGVLWGILAGFLDALPFVGTGIVLVPLSIQQFLMGNYWKMMICLGLYIICIFIRELLEPKLIGKKMGTSPIIILLSIYAGIKLFGVWGIIEGPLGYVMISQTFHSLYRENYDGQ